MRDICGRTTECGRVGSSVCGRVPGRLHLEGARSLYIQPGECVDCGACEPVCPVEAIYYEDDLPDPWATHLADNDAFSSEPLAGRAAPSGSPGGAAKVGAIGVDTTLVSGLPQQEV